MAELRGTKVEVLLEARRIFDALEASSLSASEKVKAARIAEYWITNVHSAERRPSMIAGHPYTLETLERLQENQ